MTNLSIIEQVGQPSTFDNTTKRTGRKSTVFTTKLYEALAAKELEIVEGANGLEVITDAGRYIISEQTALLCALKSSYIKGGINVDVWLKCLQGGFLSTQQRDATQKSKGMAVASDNTQGKLVKLTSRDIIKEGLSSSLIDIIGFVEGLVHGERSPTKKEIDTFFQVLVDSVPSNYSSVYEAEAEARATIAELESFGYSEIVAISSVAYTVVIDNSVNAPVVVSKMHASTHFYIAKDAQGRKVEANDWETNKVYQTLIIEPNHS